MYNGRMKRALFLLSAGLAAASLQGQAQAPNPVTTGKAYKFEAVTSGVYYATSTGSMVTGSNNVAIVGDRKDHSTRELFESIRKAPHV